MHYVDSYYSSTLSTDTARPALGAHIDTEVCVVGGGLAGLATALGLRERGADVVVLEARQVGWGASGRNGGFVGSGYSLPPERLIARVGAQQARELYQLTREAVALVRRRIQHYGMDCGPVVDGGLNVSWFDDADALRRARDFLVQYFDEQREFWPRERVAEGLHSDRYYDALFSDQKFHLHPLNYTRAVAAAAELRGATIFEQSPVQKLDADGTGMVVDTAGGQVRAAHVVITCGGYLAGLQRRLSAAMVPIATYMIATEPWGKNVFAAPSRYPMPSPTTASPAITIGRLPTRASCGAGASAPGAADRRAWRVSCWRIY